MRADVDSWRDAGQVLMQDEERGRWTAPRCRRRRPPPRASTLDSATTRRGAERRRSLSTVHLSSCAHTQPRPSSLFGSCLIVIRLLELSPTLLEELSSAHRRHFCLCAGKSAPSVSPCALALPPSCAQHCHIDKKDVIFLTSSSCGTQQEQEEEEQASRPRAVLLLLCCCFSSLSTLTGRLGVYLALYLSAPA